MGPTGCDTEGARGEGEGSEGGDEARKEKGKEGGRGGGGWNGSYRLDKQRNHAVVADQMAYDATGAASCGGRVAWPRPARRARRGAAPGNPPQRRGDQAWRRSCRLPGRAPSGATDASVEIQGALQIFFSWTGPSTVEWTPPPVPLVAGGGPPSSPLHCRARCRRRGRLASRRWGRWPRRTRERVPYRAQRVGRQRLLDCRLAPPSRRRSGSRRPPAKVAPCRCAHTRWPSRVAIPARRCACSIRAARVPPRGSQPQED